MGGDYAPKEIVLGAVEAATLLRQELILVGQPNRILEYLPSPCPNGITIHPATELIEMGEKPTTALRTKKDSSLVVCANLVKEGRAKAMVSAGNTGAATAAALLGWRQIPGVHRPAIASLMPNRHGGFLLLDAGATPDVDPIHLLEFALMGRAYLQSVLNRPNPKVHLLNIGEEEGKGNQFAKTAFKLLRDYEWFAGNIEGKDIFRTDTDVVVCDAFVGNIVLKTSEGVAEFIMNTIRDQIPKSQVARLAYLPMKNLMAPLKKKMDYAETGGSPLLGVNGLCIICHGRSNAKAIKNAILLAQTAIENNLVQTIRTSIEVGFAGRHEV